MTSTLPAFLAIWLWLPLMGDDAAKKPNIVYIMCDELGYYEPSFMGSKTIKTPRIDRLAAEGVWFTQALAGSSVCAPTRCVLMTGKHSGHTSVRVNGGGTPMRADEETVASMLKASLGPGIRARVSRLRDGIELPHQQAVDRAEGADRTGESLGALASREAHDQEIPKDDTRHRDR